MFGRHHAAGGAGNWAHAFEKFGAAYNHFRGGHHGGFYRRPKYNVPLNIVENDTYYEVHVYALGFAKENIKLSVVDDILYISGNRTIDESKAPNFSRQEYPIKSFERVVNLHGQIDKDSISARQEEGVLIVTLPKSKEAQQPEQEIKID